MQDVEMPDDGRESSGGEGVVWTTPSLEQALVGTVSLGELQALVQLAGTGPRSERRGAR